MAKQQDLRIGGLAARFGLQSALLIALVFAPAGTLAWPRGWIFVILSLIAGAGLIAWLYVNSPGLLQERMRPVLQKGQPLADKLITLVFIAASFAWLVFMPYDVFHLRLLPPPPAYLSWLGLAAWFLSMWIVFLTFRENAFAAPVVKHQPERQQKVIDTGPYAVVRHPMYAGILVYALGLPLWLGSTAGLLLAVVPFSALVLRLLFEEAYLRQHLQGYELYTRQVRWRLVPGVW